MNKCKCGCGADAPEGKEYMRGHNLNQKKQGNAPKSEEPKQAEEPRITVSNIRACGIKSENVAWFKTEEGYISKELEFFCTITNEKKEFCDYVAVVLGDGSIAPAILLPGFVAVVLEDGSIVPVVLIPGFVGIHSRYYDPEEHNTEEKQPEQPEIRDTKMPQQEEKPTIPQPDDSINNAIEELRKISNMPQPEKKKGFLKRMLGNAT